MKTEMSESYLGSEGSEGRVSVPKSPIFDPWKFIDSHRLFLNLLPGMVVETTLLGPVGARRGMMESSKA